MLDIVLDCLDGNIENIKRTICTICYQLDTPNIYVHLNKKIDKKILNHFSNFINIDENIENLVGQYIIYMNSGDAFSSPYSIKTLYKNRNCDIVVGGYVKKENTGEYREYYEDELFFYAKLYNRKFLEKHKIDLTNKVLLNDLAFMCDPQINFINEKVYILNNEEQLIINNIENTLELINKTIELKMYKNAYLLAVNALINIYHRKLNDDLDVDKNMLNKIYLIYKKYKSKYKIDIDIFNYNLTIKDIMPEISFNDFLKELEKK